jgi:hypothetical protein
VSGPSVPLDEVVYADAVAAERFFRCGAWIDRRIDQQLDECCERYGMSSPAFSVSVG